jgi:nucleotide-binding universal stress UspA family protein
MTSGHVTHVVCALRGGAESKETASCAIELARGARARLTLVHIIDPGCIDCGDLARTSAAYRQYVEDAESNLQTLARQARQTGVPEVAIQLREGNTRRELRQLAVETDAELLVLGHPGTDPQRNLFGVDEFHQFIAELDFGGDLRTVQVRPKPDTARSG